jgi:hypothetical protein
VRSLLELRTKNRSGAKTGDRKLIRYQSDLALTDSTSTLQNYMLLIPKDETDLESGFGILFNLANLFILNNMAERVGFEPT